MPNLAFFIFTTPTIYENFFFLQKMNNLTNCFNSPTPTLQASIKQFRINRLIKFGLLNFFMIQYFSNEYSLIKNYENEAN